MKGRVVTDESPLTKIWAAQKTRRDWSHYVVGKSMNGRKESIVIILPLIFRAMAAIQCIAA